MRHKKYGKTLQKAMIKRGKTLQVQDFFRRSEGSLNAHFTQVCFFLNNARL